MLFGYSQLYDEAELDKEQARAIVNSPGVPLGLIYQDTSRPSMDAEIDAIRARIKAKDVATLMSAYDL